MYDSAAPTHIQIATITPGLVLQQRRGEGGGEGGREGGGRGERREGGRGEGETHET